jgi:hypothetical protein
MSAKQGSESGAWAQQDEVAVHGVMVARRPFAVQKEHQGVGGVSRGEIPRTDARVFAMLIIRVNGIL